MHFTPLELVRCIVVLTVEGSVCCLAWSRRLYKPLPVFTTYLTAVLVCDILRYSVISTLGQRSKTEFILYWTTQWILVMIRAAVIYEICRRLLGAYPGVWRLCIGVLCLLAMVLIFVTWIDAATQGPWIARFFLTLDRGFELEVLGILVVVLAFCRYYQIPVERFVGLIVAGLSLYSALTILNDTFASHWFMPLLAVWREIRGDSFIWAECVWFAAIALWKPLQERQRAPVLLDSEVYSQMTVVVTVRLRELNARLEEILR